MSAKNPDAIDKLVGTRVRMRRNIVGLSQEKLGDALGVTFQQVQKYEKGTNRISASRLRQIATTLGVPLAYFYEEGEFDAAANVADVSVSGQGARLARAFMRVRDPQLRRSILALTEALAEAPSGDEAERIQAA